MALDPDTEPRRQRLDRLLEPVVVERDEPAAVLADEMMVVMTVREDPLEPSLPVADRDPLNEAVLDEQVKHAVDAGSAGGPTIGGPERILDLDDAQRTRLSGEEIDDAIAGAAALETRAGEDVVNVNVPIGRGHHRQD